MLRSAFFGYKLSLNTAQKAISEFKMVSYSKENVAELMLYYVECGMEFTNVYGDVDEAFPKTEGMLVLNVASNACG